jgi:hypothetical protein
VTGEFVQWLGIQLDEDERIAREATQGDWVWSREFVTPPGYHHRTIGPLEPGDAAFIAEYNPARALREIGAKRRLLELHRRDNFNGASKYTTCVECSQGYEVHEWGPKYPCGTVRLLALPYADRPGYRDEWRP